MPGKYSIIFMRDDGHSKRIRMKLSTARLLLTIILLAPFLAGGSLWLNWRLWRDRADLNDRIAELRIDLDKQAQTTTRLANLEQYLSRMAPDNLSNLVIAPADGELWTAEAPLANTASDAGSGGDDYASGDPGAEASGGGAAADPSGDPSADPSGVDAAPQAGDLDAQGQDGQDSQEGEGQPGTGEGAEGGEAAVSGELHPEVLTEPPLDTGMVRVENLSARQVGMRSLRISFDLFNTGRASSLAGKALFDLVMPDGRLYILGSQGDTNYRINNMKRMSGNPTLPPEVEDTTGAMVRVNVLRDDELVYRVLVPLQQ